MTRSNWLWNPKTELTDLSPDDWLLSQSKMFKFKGFHIGLSKRALLCNYRTTTELVSHTSGPSI